jgi:hypothetical protein
MKTLFALFVFIAMMSTAIAQSGVKVGIIGGIAPSRNIGTAPVFGNRHDQNTDFLFNGSKVEFSPAIGIAVRLNTKNQFFFEGEAMYYSMTKSYVMQYIEERISSEHKHEMKESCSSIELPLSAGVSLGKIDITSGLSMRYDFGQKSTLSQMDGLVRELQSTVFGWHSSVGINFGKVSAKLSYSQDFANYGQGIMVNGQELLLKNAPSHLRFMVGLWF